ncbi:uncharacterized protein LOC134017000 [Osmerus eperlanus]|uniref:uncharacterized protein LOC134017000 n=1 Tax=Osmerus eperlanus TaxID=29151 RepID=UPI002E1501B8
MATSVRWSRGRLLQSEVVDEMLLLISELIREANDQQQQPVAPGFTVPRMGGQTGGRPVYQIAQEQLQMLLSFNFSAKQIAEILGVSRRTVNRRLRCCYSEYVPQPSEENISSGSISLWHLDGNHKLSKWRIVIHGGIDGFSRLVVFLKASNNNRSDIVMDLFSEAVAQFGVPSRVRCDYGGKNNAICLFMDVFRGSTRGSTHNQRIERLWGDVWRGVTKKTQGPT